MWFSFPPGSSGCSIQSQNFTSEFTDAEGRDWFRAPDHFAPKILGMGLGYKSLSIGSRPDGCDVDDLAPTFGVIGAQIGEQAQVIENLKEELRLANETIQKLQAQQIQSHTQVQILSAKSADFEKENNDLRARLADFEDEQQTREALAKGNQKK